MCSTKIQNLPATMQDSWKLKKACNNVRSYSSGREDSSSCGNAPFGDHSPVAQPMGLGECGSNSGGLFKGPVIAEVEKSVREAQEGGLGQNVDLKVGFVSTPSKRKHKEELHKLSGGQTLSKGHKKNEQVKGSTKEEG